MVESFYPWPQEFEAFFVDCFAALHRKDMVLEFVLGDQNSFLYSLTCGRKGQEIAAQVVMNPFENSQK